MATENAVRSADPAAPQGHPTGFWFFFWGEFAERCSYYGMRAILALYMVERLGISKADAGTYMSLFIAAWALRRRDPLRSWKRSRGRAARAGPAPRSGG